jgi:hypothetical protein
MQIQKIEEELNILILIGLKPIQLTDIEKNSHQAKTL